jgi:hypothetical protein
MHDPLEGVTDAAINTEATEMDPDWSYVNDDERRHVGQEVFLGELPLGVEPGSADDPRESLGTLTISAAVARRAYELRHGDQAGED